jgi:hypothetical protein
MSNESAPPIRLELDVAPDALARIDVLAQQSGAQTRAEVIRQALRLYEWFLQEVDPADTVVIEDVHGARAAVFRAALLRAALRPET